MTQSIVNEAEKAAETKEPVTIGNLPEQLIGILPTNPISSIAQGQMLQIVIFGFHDFMPQVVEIHIQGVTNNLFFFLIDLHAHWITS